MASVTSLDQDMRNLRLSRFTPQAANETRAWIESSLGERLPSGDLLDGLKDGVALCKLANLAVQGQAGAIKFKANAMPFIQMENISHFLRACEMPPLSLPAHDRFLTVDLYEQKDPAQVLQCLGAFSRQAHKLNPAKFPSTIGRNKSGGAMSPVTTGGTFSIGPSFRRPASPLKPSAGMPSAAPAMSPSLTGGSNASRQSANGTKSPEGPVSSWSTKGDEGNTAPAWNIHQYGYMGGASQGNQGISFGARRQITSQPPAVPSLAEKQKLRKEKEDAEERARQQAAEERERRTRQVQEEEERLRLEEERNWEAETRRHRDEERRRIEKQKREWEEQERKWREEEESRKREDAALQYSISKSTLKRPPEKPRVPSSSILRGQTLAQYQKEQANLASAPAEVEETPEQRRVRELEKQLEDARERERQYQAEREERLRRDGIGDRSRPSTAETARPGSAQQSDVSWVADEREFARKQVLPTLDGPSPRLTQVGAQRPLPERAETRPSSSLSQRPLPEPDLKPAAATPSSVLPGRGQPSPFTKPSPFSRPLPTPAKRPEPEPFQPEERRSNRTDDYLASNPAPPTQKPRISSAQEAGDTSLEQQRLDDERVASQQKTKAGGWASKSLLEREMEQERAKQKEWEANQQALKNAPRDPTQGTGQGQSWDVNQYGWTGGDGQNRGSSTGSGINFGGKRQIIGPRPQK